MRLRITKISTLSPGLRKFTFSPLDGLLPAAGAGAHVVFDIPGAERVWKNAYSLIGGPEARTEYEIIVRRVEPSRGGSAWLHERAKTGDILEAKTPQNLFPLAHLAKKHLLLSAGIGITPFLAYAKVMRAPFEWHHCSRPENAAAFAALLPPGPHVTLHTSRNTLGLAATLGGQRLGTHLYVCGPEQFNETVISTARALGWPEQKIHTEHFGSAAGGAPFVVHLARSGRRLEVTADQTLLEAIEAAGITAPYLCRGGACGACELPLLEGIAEHRDHVLSPEQRAANKALMVCVSRACTPELVLDF